MSKYWVRVLYMRWNSSLIGKIDEDTRQPDPTPALSRIFRLLIRVGAFTVNVPFFFLYWHGYVCGDLCRIYIHTYRCTYRIERNRRNSTNNECQPILTGYNKPNIPLLDSPNQQQFDTAFICGNLSGAVWELCYHSLYNITISTMTMPRKERSERGGVVWSTCVCVVQVLEILDRHDKNR